MGPTEEVLRTISWSWGGGGQGFPTAEAGRREESRSQVWAPGRAEKLRAAGWEVAGVPGACSFPSFHTSAAIFPDSFVLQTLPPRRAKRSAPALVDSSPIPNQWSLNTWWF